MSNVLENETQRQNRKPVLLIPLISTFQLVIIRPVTKRIQLWLKNGRCIERAHVRVERSLEKKLASRRDEGRGWVLQRGEGVGMKKRRGSARFGCSWCSTGANCPFYYSAGCKSPAKFDAWLTAGGEGLVEKRGRAWTAACPFQRNFPTLFHPISRPILARSAIFFPSLFNFINGANSLCKIVENNRGALPILNSWTLRLAEKRCRRGRIAASREFVDSRLVVRFRVFSGLFGSFRIPSFRLVARSPIAQPGPGPLQPFSFDSVYTCSGNGTIDNNWWVFEQVNFLTYRVRLIFWIILEANVDIIIDPQRGSQADSCNDDNGWILTCIRFFLFWTILERRLCASIESLEKSYSRRIRFYLIVIVQRR